MDMPLAEAMGINVDNLLISPPDTAENLLCAVNTLVKSGSVDVIVVDSVRLPCPHVLYYLSQNVLFSYGSAMIFVLYAKIPRTDSDIFSNYVICHMLLFLGLVD